MNITKLNESFWCKFLEDSQFFKKPILIKSVVLNDINILRKMLFQTFLTMTNYDDSPYSLWLDGENKNEYKDLIRKGINDFEGNDLDIFCKTFFEDYKFGIIGHHNNAYNQELAKVFYNYLFFLYETLGVGLKGVDLNTFIGNYGWTPVGIHQDIVGENVIHFHLGPGKKTMYLWEPNTYHFLENETFERKIHQADYCFDIEEGDLFFMPYGYYHIGYSPDYSSAITSWFCTPTKEVFRNKILKEIGKEVTKEDNNVTSFRTSFSNEDTIDRFFEENYKDLINSHYEKLSFNDIVRLKIKRHIFSLESSLFYTRPMVLINDMPIKINNGTIMKLDSYFLIKYFVFDKITKLYLFIRGHEIILNYKEEFLFLIEKLNNYESFTISDLKNSFEENTVDTLINELLNKEALVIINE